MENNPGAKDRFPVSLFDHWAASYDQAVSNGRFPFFGYHEVLAEVLSLAEPRPGMPILDLGTGTGNLAIPFQMAGCDLWCTDYSPTMLSIARMRIPRVHFMLHNLLTPLPLAPSHRFERIVSAYVFHHFELKDKIRILNGLCLHLKQGGTIVIGDVAFPDAESRERTKKAVKGDWEEECYWQADETLAALEAAGMHGSFQQVSSCAGVFLINPAPGNPGGGSDV